jgi:hypothetical protein
MTNLEPNEIINIKAEPYEFQEEYSDENDDHIPLNPPGMSKVWISDMKQQEMKLDIKYKQLLVKRTQLENEKLQMEKERIRLEKEKLQLEINVLKKNSVT